MSRNNTSYLKRLYTCPSTQTSPSSKYYPNSTDEKHASKKDVLQMTENQSQSGLSNERYVSFCVCCVRVYMCVHVLAHRIERSKIGASFQCGLKEMFN